MKKFRRFKDNANELIWSNTESRGGFVLCVLVFGENSLPFTRTTEKVLSDKLHNDINQFNFSVNRHHNQHRQKKSANSNKDPLY